MRKDKLAVCHVKATKKTDKRKTPKPFFEAIQKHFGVKFTIDIAADSKNTLCKKFFDEKKDALKQSWKGIAFCNPPYSMAEEFVDLCCLNAKTGHGSTCMLMAARTDTPWWNVAIQNAYKIVFIRGRIKFKGAEAGAPFPSVLIVFKKGYVGLLPEVSTLILSPYERGFERGKPK